MHSRLDAFAIGAIIAVANANGGTAHARTSASCPRVEVPMLFYGTRPAVHVSVGGRGPYLFLIDTGAQGVGRADTSLVQELRLKAKGQVEASDIPGRPAKQLNEIELPSLSLGKFNRTKVIVLSRDYNTSDYLPKISGILGFGYFDGCALTLDYANARVTVGDHFLPPPNGRDILPFRLTDGIPVIDVRIGSESIETFLDTGNIRAIDLPLQTIRKLPLASFPRLVGFGGSISGRFELREITLRDPLIIAGHSIEQPHVTSASEFTEANLGSALFQRFAITFDLKNHRVQFQRTERDPEKP